MLVLSRKAQEGVRIGDDVVITVLSVQRGRVKLGIEAPSNIHVERSELREQALQPNEV
jgi:carbon storage regulator